MKYRVNSHEDIADSCALLQKIHRDSQRREFEDWIVKQGYRTREQIDEELNESGPDYGTVLMTELWAGWQCAQQHEPKQP